MSIYGDNVTNLIEQLGRLPGVGAKSAARLAFHIINMEEEQVAALANAIVSARAKVSRCEVCQTITDVSPCSICSSHKRDQSVIMVVEDARDMAAYERTREYNGLYHVLQGAISPMQGIGPEQLKMKELVGRIKDGVEEVIIATNPNVEGEATAMYINRLLKDMVKVTRIAHGVPVGGDLEYVDDITLARALDGRREL